MPVGTTNSALKSSFSLSSLRSCPTLDSPDQGMRLPFKAERPYHSLTKQTRQRHHQLEKEIWRKSWGSVVGQDDRQFSEAFQADYDYLMSQNILEKAGEDRSPQTPTAPLVWSFSELNDQFAQLCSWLGGIQESLISKEENVTDRKSRAEKQECLQQHRYRREKFNEESKRLMDRFPDLKGEVSCCIKLTNEMWDSVESLIGSRRKACEGQKRRNDESKERIKNEMRCLRKWMRDLEPKLKPMDFQQTWTKSELEAKAREHEILDRDIEAHSHVVSSIVKLCEKIDPSSLAAAKALQRKYYEYRLLSFEWKCYIEIFQPDKNSTIAYDSDGEPGAKKLKSEHEPDPYVGELEGESKAENERFFNFGGLPTHGTQPKETWQNSFPDSSAGKEAKNSSGNYSPSLPEMHIIENDDDEESRLPESPEKEATDSGRSERRESSAATKATDTAQRRHVGLSPESQKRRIDRSPVAEAKAEVSIRASVRKPNIATLEYLHLDTDPENSDREIVNQCERVSAEDSDAKDGEETTTTSSTTTSSDDGWTYEAGKNKETGMENRKSKPAAAVRLDFSEGNVWKKENSDKATKHFSVKSNPSATRNPNENSNDSIIRELVDRADEMVRCKSTNSLEMKNQRAAKIRSRVSGDARNNLDCYDASSEYTAEESDDLEGSVITCRKSESAEGIVNDFSVSKSPSGVVLRNPRHRCKIRPSSMSCMPSCIGQRINVSRTQFSASESALNKMSAKDHPFSPKGRKMQWQEDSGGSGSLRRRRNRTRRRSTLNKSDSCAESTIPNGSDSQPARSSPNKEPANLRGPVNSGSFSGTSPKQVADQSAGQTKCTDSGSGTETDEDGNRLTFPVFKLGLEEGQVTVSNEHPKIQGEEQLSLNSDQVDWDNYQEEKYQSEAYSEDAPDPDLVKKVLEFGEDYRKYIDSQSECEETRKIFHKEQQGELSSQEHRFASTVVKSRDPIFTSNSFDDAAAAHSCEGLLYGPDCLLHDCDISLFEKCECPSRREQFGVRISRAKHESRKESQLREEMMLLENDLCRLARVAKETEAGVATKKELELKIERMKGELDFVRKLKHKLRQINCSVRFVPDTGQSACSLRENVDRLYMLWDGTFEEMSLKLCTLQRILQTWLEFEELLTQFRYTLDADRDTLKALDFALSAAPYGDVDMSVKDVARLLFDKEVPVKGQLEFEGTSKAECTLRISGPTAASTEGSLSDSGISDSGSEHEMTEREKKLARLKRLQKHLEGVLIPGGPELAELSRRLEEAETELRRLQKNCRDLFERTACATSKKETVEEEISSSDFKTLPARLGKVLSPQSAAIGGRSPCENGGLDSDDDDPCSGKSWFWRVIRTALPFQIALVALLCVACLLEPHCCDTLNNLGTSFAQQLRYNRNPPPT